MIDKIRMAELTSEEARQHLDDGAVVLLPMGSLEDQGTHAPMGDYRIADAVAMDIARASREAGVPTFVAPPIPFGGKDFFESSHGGVSLRHATLTALLDDLLGCFARHGLRKVLIVNGHGGNVSPIAESTMRARQSHDMFVASMYLWEMCDDLLEKILGKERALQSAGHGANPLTSAAMHYFPDLVRHDLMRRPTQGLTVGGIEVGGYGRLSYGGALFHAPVEAAENAPDGVGSGDPYQCSAETGKALVGELVRIGAGFVRDHVAHGFADIPAFSTPHS